MKIVFIGSETKLCIWFWFGKFNLITLFFFLILYVRIVH